MDDYELLSRLASEPLSHSGRISILTELFGSSLQADMKRYVDSLKQEFVPWISALFSAEPPQSDIVAFNFGLFELEKGFELYLSGSLRFDEADSDWPCNNDYWPEGRYLNSTTLNSITENLEGIVKEPWMVVQALVIVMLKDYLDESGDDFDRFTGLTGSRIATSFDDGDIYVVR
ncbi:MAG: hypothetical protein AB9903_08910 [Vulcanimicrobiota bacterium]